MSSDEPRYDGANAWKEHAACKSTPEEVSTVSQLHDWIERWIPPPGYAAQRYNRAKEICDQCPVMEDCLQYSLEHRIRNGMWGGVSPPQRRVLLKFISEPQDWSEHVGAEPWLRDLFGD